MNTLKEFQDFKTDLEFSIDKVEQVKLCGKVQDLLNKVVKHGKLFLALIDILAKYFYKNGKISAPSPFRIWVYFALVKELFIFFKNLNNENDI